VSLRLIASARPRVHHDALDWARRVAANGGAVSQATLRAVSTFCDAIDRAGIRDRFYRLNLFCGTGLTACLVPLYRGPSLSGTQFGSVADTNFNFVAGDYVEAGSSGGLIGNGTSKYLDTGVNLLFSTQTDTHMAVYENQVAAGNDKTLIGADALGSTPRSIYTIYQLNSGQLTYYDGTTFANPFYLATRSAAFYIGSNQATRRDIFRNGVSVSATTGAKTGVGTSATQTYKVFAAQQGAGVTGIYAGRFGGYSLGLGLSASQAAAYNTAMQAFQTALGRNV